VGCNAALHCTIAHHQREWCNTKGYCAGFLPEYGHKEVKKLAQILILVAALLALLVSYILTDPAHAWWQSFLQNFGAGLCSALVLIWLYDQVLEREAQKIKMERNRVAAAQLVALLRGHIYGLLFPMYRSAVARKPDNKIETWKEFLTVKFPDQMPHLDISARSPGSFPEVTPYPKFISDSLLAFSSRIQSWLSKYGAVVDADLVDASEQVINSGFIILGCHLEQTANFAPLSFPSSYSFVQSFKFDPTMCQDYGTKLSNLVDSVERKLPNTISKFEEQYWHNACLDIGYARRMNKT
jgi:hypothetical protein